MGATAGIMLFAGAGMQAVGSIASAKAKSQAADFNRDISLQNSEIAKQQTKADVISLRKKQYQQLGAIRAAVGASGVTMEGSPLEVLEESVIESTLDLQRAEYAGTLRERGYATDALLYGAEGKTAKTSGYFGAASSLLMGGARAYDYGRPVPIASRYDDGPGGFD
ncbi:MAG: hypothetical protein NUV55_04755 [Sulfuricaulis sp.]|uniref:hypothetical protein n=1 Tax=Sulfuricaulis sp. TaxID=2003553 RepID=UPI0025F8F965|nr:hypothetical protein [Sulfuricaulis sp.]MCR4346497.1 hypothetical protein [Sulfuricaulis sp.]